MGFDTGNCRVKLIVSGRVELNFWTFMSLVSTTENVSQPSEKLCRFSLVSIFRICYRRQKSWRKKLKRLFNPHSWLWNKNQTTFFLLFVNIGELFTRFSCFSFFFFRKTHFSIISTRTGGFFFIYIELLEWN